MFYLWGEGPVLSSIPKEPVTPNQLASHFLTDPVHLPPQPSVVGWLPSLHGAALLWCF